MTRVMMRVGCGIMSRRLAGGDVNAQAGSSTYALLTDGTTIEIRATRPDDFDAVRNMHAKMSSENLYLRFFGLSRSAAEGEARRTCREPAPDHAGLLAVLEGQVVGCGSYEVAGDGSRSAEVAMAVADGMHRRGVGTLLLEHLISLARGRGVRTFVATTLSENALMMQVFADAGLGARRALVDGVYEVSFPLPAGEGTPGVVRGHRREPTPRFVRAGHPEEHRRRRLFRPGLCGQPGRGRTGWRALRAVGGGPALAGGPGGHRPAGPRRRPSP